MKVMLRGFKQDSDVDFQLQPENEVEKVLLKAMAARRATLCFDNPTPDILTVRMRVVGKRNNV